MNRGLITIDNRRLRLSDYPDKTIVLNLFASWCGPCVLNLRDLVLVSKTYRVHPIEVIGLVSHKNDPNIAFVRRFLRHQKVKFPVIWDNNDFGESLVKAINGHSVIPQTFVIDKFGRIQKHFEGYSPLNSSQLLREALDQVGQETKATMSR